MRWTGSLVAAVAVGATALGGAALGPGAGAPLTGPERAGAAQGRTVWLCRPGLPGDPCSGDLTTTVQARGQADRVVPEPVPATPPVDCFYVYPTVSNQLGPSASRTVEPELESIARFQAQRFSQQCRVFAPVYRQRTLVALVSANGDAAVRRTAYADVAQAFDEYLRDDNRGRGIVLVGHSQGTGILRRLLRERFDGAASAPLRARLVSALLLGGNVTVAAGRDRGGDLADVPLCTREAQAGCVIAYSTYAASPPATSRFGRVTPGIDPQTEERLPATGREVACVNPASIAANAPTELTSYVPSRAFAPGGIAAGVLLTYGGLPPRADTPWVRPADRYRARCVREGGAHVLRLSGVDGARPLQPFPEPGWGVHLVDVNVALGDLQRAVVAQTATWRAEREAAARPPASTTRLAPFVTYTGRERRVARRACRAGTVTVRVAGPDVTGMLVRVGGRAVGSDVVAPYRVRFAARRLSRARLTRVRVEVERTGGLRTVRTKRMRRC
jgi:hypothetical protein